MSKYGFLMRYS